MALILFRTQNISAKCGCEATTHHVNFHNSVRHLPQGGATRYSTVINARDGWGRRERHKHRRSEAGKTGIGTGSWAAVYSLNSSSASRRDGAESAQGQTEAYSVQFDDCVHLANGALRVHVDDDVTCGAREGVGGSAGWGARLRAAIGEDHVAVH